MLCRGKDRLSSRLRNSQSGLSDRLKRKQPPPRFGCFRDQEQLFAAGILVQLAEQHGGGFRRWKLAGNNLLVFGWLPI